MFKIKYASWLAVFLCGELMAATSSDFAATPPNITDTSDPFVMINLSVELTQQAEAYTDGEQTYVGGTYCPGRLNDAGICYFSTETYLGYFDPDKCYVYDETGANTHRTQLASGPRDDFNGHYFRPVGSANSSHECGGSHQFSGNFMNWATMTALDSFRRAMTGGARIVDTAGEGAKTLLTRTHRYGDWDFVKKEISSASSGSHRLRNGGIDFINDVSRLTPFSETAIRVDNGNDGEYGNRVRFYDQDDNLLGTYNVIVEVCKASDPEPNCVEYTDGVNDPWYKPEGVMQKNALQMRFALTSYTGDDSHDRNGGVLRANAKYIGYHRPLASGGLEVNPIAEVDEDGLLVYDPDNLAGADGVNNSGILNYINSFGLGSERYKSHDPVAELFYEGLRYFKNLGSTPEYSGASGTLPALTNSQKDNFPVLTSWDDPIVNACQKNFMVAIGDQFAWEDHNLPGSSIWGSTGIPTRPSNPDTDIDVDALTDTVGTLEGFHSGTLGAQTRGRNNNGWYVAGLAYYANTNDIRDDLPGTQKVKSFFVDTQEFNSDPPIQQDNPLWLAAKYGGFDDANGDGDPGDGTAGATTDEWDADGDGEPDAYTLASQPANLVAGLNRAFTDIASRVSAGSAASVVTNSSAGQGAIYQGLYKPSITRGADRVEWLGLLHSLFVDAHGNFREDSDGDDTLTNADTVITFGYDPIEKKSVVIRNVTTDSGATFTPIPGDPVDIENLDSIWNARDTLADLSDVISQRSYTSSAGGGRHIITAIDSDNDGKVTNDDLVSFDENTFVNASDGINDNFRYLGLDDTTGNSAENIVNFIRGEEGIAGFRSRTIDFDSDGADEVWRLGDIISSSPVTVSRPNERYDLRYGDDTYVAFREQYFNRRQMVYVGANDGMLHAFNAGFYDSTNQAFSTTPTDGGTATAHPLGSELWAYVPYNVLPHLRWLTELDYPHVYYVDGIPQVFEANIFNDDSTHPNGWGTILVVGLRFGGGEITFDPDNDLDGDTSDDVTTRSSYIVLDITDPEQPPTLLAEISHPDMGYTTSRPTLIKRREPDAGNGSFADPAVNEWHLVFGSGPAGSNATQRDLALTDGVSDKNARLFVFDLNSMSFVDNVSGDPFFEIPLGGSGFAGDLTAVDWNENYSDDVVYFGLVQGSVASPEGDLMRFVPSMTTSAFSSSFSRLMSGAGANKPFTGPPHVTRSNGGDYWVHAGSGRYLVPDDALSSVQQSYFGIKEPKDASGALTFASVDLGNDVVETTGIRVFTDGHVEDSQGDNPFDLNTGQSVGSFNALKAAIAEESGWYLDFSDPRYRNVGASGQVNVSILFTEYRPSGIACDPLGETFLNAVHFETGTASPHAAIGTDSSVTHGADGELAEIATRYGQGLIRDVVVDDKHDRAIGQDSTGALGTQDVESAPPPKGRLSWREIEIDW